MSAPVTKAVVLAAGRGTRMRELTRTMPKPMVEVSGKPILSYILEGLREFRDTIYPLLKQAGLRDFG